MPAVVLEGEIPPIVVEGGRGDATFEGYESSRCSKLMGKVSGIAVCKIRRAADALGVESID